MNDFDNVQGTDWTSATFTATLAASADARRAIPGLLGDVKLDEERCGDLALLVSELVTNAVAHSDTDSVCVSMRPGRVLRVCVRDYGGGTPQMSNHDIGGWGLRLINSLSVNWGIVPLATGKVVWFDLPTQGGSDPPS